MYCAVCGVIGFDTKRNRRVASSAEYIENFGTMFCVVAGCAAVIWVIVRLFGWPELSE
jgi:hypothetical protein